MVFDRSFDKKKLRVAEINFKANSEYPSWNFEYMKVRQTEGTGSSRDRFREKKGREKFRNTKGDTGLREKGTERLKNQQRGTRQTKKCRWVVKSG